MFGQADGSGAAETLHSVADVTRSVTEPAARAYKAHLDAEVQRERIRAGLPPTVLLPPPLPQPQPRSILSNPIVVAAAAILLYKLLFSA